MNGKNPGMSCGRGGSGGPWGGGCGEKMLFHISLIYTRSGVLCGPVGLYCWMPAQCHKKLSLIISLL
jgi:hypothetical protein